MEVNMFCVPGDRLCIGDDKTIGGRGTFIKGSYIYSSLAGRVNVIQNKNEKIIEVITKDDINKKIPSIGDIVTCKVNKISSTQCKCLIYTIGDQVLKHTFKSIIRKEDVRSKDKDNVNMYKCYRPGDIVIARVIGLSDYGYFLSTAADELGVILAKSEYDVMMVPISKTEVICPKTMVREMRKVAKVVVDELNLETNFKLEK